MLKKIILISILAPLVFGKILKVKDEGASYILFDYKEVCTFFGKKDVILANKVNASTIDCMGFEFKIQNFCESKFSKDLAYTRARFDIAEKKISCQKAQAVIVKLLCDKKHKSYCENSQSGCNKLRPFLAKNHELARDTLLGNKLTCYFTAKTEIDLNKSF